MNIRQVFNTVPASSGNQDYTISGFGVVQACRVIITSATSNDTTVNPRNFCYGVWDGTNIRSISSFDKHGVGTTVAKRSASNSNIVALIDPTTGATINRSATISAVTDGIRLTWGSGGCSSYMVMVELINGIVSADVDHLNTSSTLGGTASTTSPGFEPDVLFTLHARQAFNNTIQSNLYASCGAAVNASGGIEQGCIWQYSRNGVGTSEVEMLVSNQRVSGRTGSGDATYEVTSFDTNGFTLTTRDNTPATVEAVAFLALKLNGTPEVAVDYELTPTSTGNTNFTSAGFEPEYGFSIGTGFRVADINTYRNDTRASNYVLSSFTANEERSMGQYSADNQTTTITSTRNQNSAVAGVDSTSGNRAYRGLFSAWISTGVTLNFNDIDSNQRYFLLMLIKDGVAATVEDRKVIQRGVQIGLQRGIE